MTQYTTDKTKSDKIIIYKNLKIAYSLKCNNKSWCEYSNKRGK